MRRGLWSPEEDEKLFNYIIRYGIGRWSSLPQKAGLQRCGKSCRLRWLNYLRPDIKRGSFSKKEEDLIIALHRVLGNRWAQIAGKLPGRTDNEIKNFWNSNLKKKLKNQGIDPNTHTPVSTAIQVGPLEECISNIAYPRPITTVPVFDSSFPQLDYKNFISEPIQTIEIENNSMLVPRPYMENYATALPISSNLSQHDIVLDVWNSFYTESNHYSNSGGGNHGDSLIDLLEYDMDATVGVTLPPGIEDGFGFLDSSSLDLL